MRQKPSGKKLPAPATKLILRKEKLNDASWCFSLVSCRAACLSVVGLYEERKGLGQLGAMGSIMWMRGDSS